MTQKRQNRKKERVTLSQDVKVVMCSIGAQVKYELKTRDISYTGFFLDFDSPGRFPFTKSSIMEIWMTLDEENTIFCNGKMARVVYPDSSQQQNFPGPG
ncbi:MAG: hypothetical protein CMP10_11280, partial [Zetaproteobacteria bacterium]|nr:hypothetical protein [Pseudobdellovibrionaceae bacterium]